MRQIFILERDELSALRSGEPLQIILGGQTITLQADVVRKQIHAEAIVDKRTRAYRMHDGKKTITEQVIDLVRSDGPMTCAEVSQNLGVGRAAVASALARFAGISVRRTGKGRRAVWRAKV